jgi:hypothetical protein
MPAASMRVTTRRVKGVAGGSWVFMVVTFAWT